MTPVRLHKDYDPKEFTYDRIEKAWQAINGSNSQGRFFFVGHIVNQPFGGGGYWMAFLRRPRDMSYVDVPFESNEGFHEPGEAENAIHQRTQELGWRIEEISVDMIPTEVEKLELLL